MMRLALAVAALALLAGCLPPERLNEACEWVGDPPRELDLSQRADRKHLELDVRIAEELGVRHGDALAPVLGIPANDRPGRECTAALKERIGQIHGVPASAIARATGARDPGIDFLTMHLPMLLLFALVAALVLRRVDRVFEPDERWLKRGAVAAIAIVAAGLAVPLAEMWAWQVETARLRDGHISYRAFRLPVAQHRLEAWALGVLVFGCVAAARSRRPRRTITAPR